MIIVTAVVGVCVEGGGRGGGGGVISGLGLVFDCFWFGLVFWFCLKHDFTVAV